MIEEGIEGSRHRGIEQKRQNREWTPMNANKDIKAKRKHPQITQITQII